MKLDASEIEVNGVKYLPKDSTVATLADRDEDGLEYKIVRTQSAGVFAGYVEEQDGQVVTLINARRIWYWVGAASLSQLAIDGTSKPKDCKFPAAVPRVQLLQAIEILDVTSKAQKSIQGVPEWKQ